MVSLQYPKETKLLTFFIESLGEVFFLIVICRVFKGSS